MTLFIVISLLVGMALGQRFNVLVLVPALALTLVLTIGTGIGHADALGAIVAMVVATITSLQVGYLAGAFGTSWLRHGPAACAAPPSRGRREAPHIDATFDPSSSIEVSRAVAVRTNRGRHRLAMTR
jgi:hypothetical protein